MWARLISCLTRPGVAWARRRLDDETRREFDAHLGLLVDRYIRSGLTPEEAHVAARRQFGNVTRLREEMYRMNGIRWFEGLTRDLRQACRSLRRAPGFAAVAVITLGIGIAATTTVFSAVDALLIRPLPVAAPHELYVVRRAGETRARFAFDFYRALDESSGAFSSVLATFTFPVTVADSESGQRASAGFVTPNYFELLGVRPQLGRLFRDEADRTVAVISDRFWKERFNGRASIVGESVRIGGTPFVIAGVAQASFGGLQLDLALDLWLPMSASQEAIQIPPFRTRVDIVGRLAPGLSSAAGISRVSTEYRRWVDSGALRSARSEAPAIVLLPASHGLESGIREQFRASLSLLVGICLCLWVITIVNVSGLLTARLRERSREIGVRLALGVTSPRLFVQLLAECVVLLLGGVWVGALVATVVAAAIPEWMPSWEGVDVRVSPAVLIATVITAALAAVVVTSVQSLSIDRRRLMRYLVPGVSRFAGRRFRFSACLVGAQLALTLPLTVVASLLLQSFHNLGNVETGFARSNLLQIDVEPVLVGYSAERARAYYTALIERLRAVPGISDASVSTGGALSGFDGMARLREDGVREDVRANAVGEGYFRTLDIRVISGRTFESREARSDEKVVIVNAALARRLFGNEEGAVGQILTLDGGAAVDRQTVIGVVENTTDANLRERATPTLYLPAGRSALLVVHVRTATDPTALIPAIRRTAASIDPNVPILDIETIDSRRRGVLQRERLLAVTSTVIAWLALVLSAVGLFGLISHAVATRRREIGIRRALGATRSHIVLLFLKDTASILVFGGLLGLGTAIALARAAQGFLYGISATDVITYAGATCLLVLVATAATILPLRRPMRVEAFATLRDD